MEMADLGFGEALQLSHFEHVGDGFLERNLIQVVQLHEHHMHDINDDQNVDGSVWDLEVSGRHEVRLDSQIDEEQQCVTSGDPPVNSRILRSQSIKEASDDEC